MLPHFHHQRETGVGCIHSFEKAAEKRLIKSALKSRACHIREPTKAAFLIAFSPDGQLIATTHGNHCIYVCRVNSGELLHCLKGHRRTPWSLTYHPTNGNILASGCLSGEIRVWDLQTGLCDILTVEGSSAVASLAFHPLERLLAIATADKLLFWDWSQKYPFAESTTCNSRERVRYVNFNSTGTYLFTGIMNSTNPNDRLHDAYNHNNIPAGVMPQRCRQLMESRRELIQLRDSLSQHYNDLRQRYNQLLSRYEELQNDVISRFPDEEALAIRPPPLSPPPQSRASTSSETPSGTSENRAINDFDIDLPAYIAGRNRVLDLPEPVFGTGASWNRLRSNRRRRPLINRFAFQGEELAPVYHIESFLNASDDVNRVMREHGYRAEDENSSNSDSTEESPIRPTSPLALEGLQDAVSYARIMTQSSMNEFMQTHRASVERLQHSYSQLSRSAARLVQMFRSTYQDLIRLQNRFESRQTTEPEPPSSVTQAQRRQILLDGLARIEQQLRSSASLIEDIGSHPQTMASSTSRLTDSAVLVSERNLDRTTDLRQQTDILLDCFHSLRRRLDFIPPLDTSFHRGFHGSYSRVRALSIRLQSESDSPAHSNEFIDLAINVLRAERARLRMLIQACEDQVRDSSDGNTNDEESRQPGPSFTDTAATTSNNHSATGGDLDEVLPPVLDNYYWRQMMQENTDATNADELEPLVDSEPLISDADFIPSQLAAEEHVHVNTDEVPEIVIENLDTGLIETIDMDDAGPSSSNMSDFLAEMDSSLDSFTSQPLRLPTSDYDLNDTVGNLDWISPRTSSSMDRQPRVNPGAVAGGSRMIRTLERRAELAQSFGLSRGDYTLSDHTTMQPDDNSFDSDQFLRPFTRDTWPVPPAERFGDISRVTSSRPTSTTTNDLSSVSNSHGHTNLSRTVTAHYNPSGRSINNTGWSDNEPFTNAPVRTSEIIFYNAPESPPPTSEATAARFIPFHQRIRSFITTTRNTASSLFSRNTDSQNLERASQRRSFGLSTSLWSENYVGASNSNGSTQRARLTSDDEPIDNGGVPAATSAPRASIDTENNVHWSDLLVHEPELTSTSQTSMAPPPTSSTSRVVAESANVPPTTEHSTPEPKRRCLTSPTTTSLTSQSEAGPSGMARPITSIQQPPRPSMPSSVSTASSVAPSTVPGQPSTVWRLEEVQFDARMRARLRRIHHLRQELEAERSALRRSAEHYSSRRDMHHRVLEMTTEAITGRPPPITGTMLGLGDPEEPSLGRNAALRDPRPVLNMLTRREQGGPIPHIPRRRRCPAGPLGLDVRERQQLSNLLGDDLFPTTTAQRRAFRNPLFEQVFNGGERRLEHIPLDDPMFNDGGITTSSQLDREEQEGSVFLNRAVTRAVAGAFIGSGDVAVATNIMHWDARVQMWPFPLNNRSKQMPDLTERKKHLVVNQCKLHNDGSISISRCGQFLAAFVPAGRLLTERTASSSSAWVQNYLRVVSLRLEDRGAVLYQHKFDANAISVDISPTAEHIIVGLSSRRYLSNSSNRNQPAVQVFKLQDRNLPAYVKRKSTCPLELVIDIDHCDIPDNGDPNNSQNDVFFFSVRSRSLNVCAWLPTPGQGIAYCTNRGSVIIVGPKGKNKPGERMRNFLFDPIPLAGRRPFRRWNSRRMLIELEDSD